ncbi:MAG: NADH-quinone oxidoreductase subunit B family protein [Leptospirillia bacterium]
MWKLLWKILKTGTLTESTDRDRKDTVHGPFHHSASIRHVDAGSCNGCELELWALENPVTSLSSRGFSFVASPRHADILLVTGPVSCHMKEALEATYQAMPAPKRILAVGDCAISGGVFRGSYATHDGLSSLLPPDVSVHGCPPSPEAIVSGVLQAFESSSRES